MVKVIINNGELSIESEDGIHLPKKEGTKDCSKCSVCSLHKKCYYGEPEIERNLVCLMCGFYHRGFKKDVE